MRTSEDCLGEQEPAGRWYERVRHTLEDKLAAGVFQSNAVNVLSWIIL